MTTAALPGITSAASDLELVAASRLGSREAFGLLVRRYQAMITGLIYATCGDLHRSEDLAQETFISAWKSLSGLREPGKLTAWLCQIARRRMLDQARTETRDRVGLKRFASAQSPVVAPSPEGELLSTEERELLWRTLSEIPQPYRETLVLYYRQQQSTATVAAAMETTEASVRQRLNRGRDMMREQVAVMLERDLARSAPTPAFAMAVVAALPALVPAGAKAATIGAAVKGSALAGGAFASIASAALFFAGPILGLFGGIFGSVAGYRAAKTPRQRSLAKGSIAFIWITMLLMMAILLGLESLRNSHYLRPRAYLLLLAATWLGFPLLMGGVTLIIKRRQISLVLEEGIPAAPGSPTTTPPPDLHASHRFIRSHRPFRRRPRLADRHGP